MNPWPFVIAAYGVVMLGVVALSLASWRAMRRAERASDAMKDRR
ncbi:heme exporter protein CcmD [Sphingomonas sp. FW199]|nr:heme exporter protein CcmD [Sphingomonas sp. BGYR3]MDG5488180.1 hypothetical protein [Sphingomonas sp. BGYR3]